MIPNICYYLLDRLGSSRRRAVIGIAFLAILSRAALLPWVPAPDAYIHDEHAYLLGADTLAHGRIANPPHPYWRFFESVHVIPLPAYAQKYPLGTAAFMALGQVVFRSPFAGVLLMLGLFAGALCWMLQAWMPPGWAVLGSVYAILLFGFTHYWSNSYWGGHLAAAGAALALGAYGRIVRNGVLRPAVPLAVGAILIWFTRPYEGGAFLAAIACVAAVRIVRGRIATRGRTARFAAILCCFGAATVGAQAYINFRTTGDVRILPYALHADLYESVPVLWLQRLHQPSLASDNEWITRIQSEFAMDIYSNLMSKPLTTRLSYVLSRTRVILETQFGVFVDIAILLGLMTAFFDRSALDLLVILALGVAAAMAETFGNVHYYAPIIVAILAMQFRALWRLRSVSWRGRPLGPYVTAVFLVAMLVASGYQAAASVGRAAALGPSPRHVIAAYLARQPGQHLVFIRYGIEHNIHDGWVWNGADLYSAPILWVYDRGPAEDEKLIRMYPKRRLWLVEPDARPLALRPYGPGTVRPAPMP